MIHMRPVLLPYFIQIKEIFIMAISDPCKALSSLPTVTPISYSGFLADDAAAGGEKQDIDKITWVMANDLNNDAKFVVDGTNRNDVNLGTLGNCWFLSALVGVSKVSALLDRVVSMDQSF